MKIKKHIPLIICLNIAFCVFFHGFITMDAKDSTFNWRYALLATVFMDFAAFAVAKSVGILK